MILTINNLDCTSSLASAAKITRKLNHPATCAFTLITPSAIPQIGDRIILAKDDGVKLFTGYISAAPAAHYEGWDERGAVYRYDCSASGDEFLLDAQPLPARPDFTDRSAGACLRELTNSISPGGFDLSGIQDLDHIPQFTPAREAHWSTHARHIARLARAAYRAHDGAVTLAPVGAVTHSLDEASDDFCPDGLTVAGAKPAVTEVTVLSSQKDEPRLYCKDYFIAAANIRSYSLGHTPFANAGYTIAEEDFPGPLGPLLWKIADPTSAISVTNGKLLLAGGPGAATDGALTLTFTEQLELAANITIDHCYALFSGASSGILGGIYNGSVAAANCLAGFSVTADSSGASTIAAIVNGAPAGTPASFAALYPVALVTRVYCQEQYRTNQPFHSSQHPAGSPRGGDVIAASIRVVLTVEPADGSAASPTVIYDGVIAGAPPFCTYALINGGVINASLTHTRIAREALAEVQTTNSSGTRTRPQGSTTGGGECAIFTSTRTLHFYSSFSGGETIVARYRSSGRAVAMAGVVPAAPAGMAAAGRSATRTILEPAIRTTADAENAALALLDDSSGALEGEYKCWSDFLDADVWPGHALALNLPSRQLNGTAIVREVDLLLEDLTADHSQYDIKFANDAATVLGFSFEIGGHARPLATAIIVPVAGTTYLPSLVNCEVTSIGAGIINVDCGVAPSSGGGIEVRRTDTAWGLADSYTLVGRFNTQTFTLAKLQTIVDFYVRQYDANGNYSRYSSALHVDAA